MISKNDLENLGKYVKIRKNHDYIDLKSIGVIIKIGKYYDVDFSNLIVKINKNNLIEVKK